MQKQDFNAFSQRQRNGEHGVSPVFAHILRTRCHGVRELPGTRHVQILSETPEVEICSLENRQHKSH